MMFMVCTKAWAQDNLSYLVDAVDWASAVQAAAMGDSQLLSDTIRSEDTTAWLHLELENSDTEILYFATSDLLAYQIYSIDDSAELAVGGDLLPTDERPIWNPEFMIPLDIHWGSELLVKLEISPGSQVPFQLLTRSEGSSITTGRLLRDGMFYGSMGLMAVLALFLSVFFRDQHAGRLSVTLTIWLLTVVSAWGYGDLMSNSAIPTILVAISNHLIVLASLITAWFGWCFLQESAAGNFFLKGLKVCFWASFVYMAVSVFVPVSNASAAVFVIATGFFGVTTSLISSIRGDAASRFLVASAALVSLPFVLLFISPPSQQVVMAIAVGAQVMVIFAVVRRIGDRMRIQEVQAEIAAERQRFLASMSHEIRTPLNGIIGYSELINEEHEPGKVKEFLDHIYQSSKMLLNIVNDVLDYAKLREDRISIRPEPFKLNSELESILTIIHPLAIRNQVDVSIDLDDDVAEYIVTDRHRCAQVLINLITNAVKFSEKGKVNIQVHQADDSLCFDVTDNGIGIESEALERLFDPFQQAQSNAASRFDGTGLGLTISKQLAELLGGTLTAKSEPGVGSTFTLTIPYTEGEFTASTTKPELHSIDLQGLHVLLAEDNPVNAKLATHILEKSGISVDQAENGDVAATKAMATEYDIILMDMQMPKMSGTEATIKLREKGYSNPIIAMTANSADSDREACLQSGMNDYLSKPISSSNLLTKLEYWSTKSVE